MAGLKAHYCTQLQIYEINQQQISYDFTSMQNLKAKQMKKQNYRCREHIGGFQSNGGCGVDKMSKRG